MIWGKVSVIWGKVRLRFGLNTTLWSEKLTNFLGVEPDLINIADVDALSFGNGGNDINGQPALIN